MFNIHDLKFNHYLDLNKQDVIVAELPFSLSTSKVVLRLQEEITVRDQIRLPWVLFQRTFKTPNKLLQQFSISKYTNRLFLDFTRKSNL